ncbi:hypothetical protein ACFPM3_17560 [Streptomyces coeruleoprunus]|uniref:Uncharacterized protein n=1 Tax=Streptomyces coeruleoprunus TaxID=285563 RepID=A0ABV9XI29_9ACTN
MPVTAGPDATAPPPRSGGGARGRHPVEEWFDGVWARTRLVRVLAGGEDAGPLGTRPLLGSVESDDALAELRALSTRGAIGDDTCRCHGSLTIALHDAEGDLLGRASLHGMDALLWEGGRFCGNLDVADPVGLVLFLARHGAVRWLAHLSGRLAYALGLREGRPQFREAGNGRHGARLLEVRRVPEPLRPRLAGMSGHDCGRLPDDQVEELRRLLSRGEPDPQRRAMLLLAWLGRLPEPMEADYGEGVLVRSLLRDLRPLAAARAAGPADPHVALGLLRWLGGQRETEGVDADALAEYVGAFLRKARGAHGIGGRSGTLITS